VIQYKTIAGPIGLTVGSGQGTSGSGQGTAERWWQGTSGSEQGTSGSGQGTSESGQGTTKSDREDYEDAVKRYAAIIDENAVGGWELMWIQQIPVTRYKVNIGGVVGVAVILAAIGAAIGAAAAGYGELMSGISGGGFIGGIGGILIGVKFCKEKVAEFFNMLIFAKKE